MLKTITYFLCAVVLSAAFGADDDLEVLWEYPYELELMNAAYACWGQYYTQDHFTFEADAYIEAIEYWGIYGFPDDDYHPQPFHINIRYDHYGMPGEVFDGGRFTNIVETDTGDDYGYGEFTYRVWHYRANFVDGSRTIPGGTTWWLEIWSEADNFQWAIRHSTDNIMYHQWNQVNGTAFFRLLGHFEETAVQPASWGEIKAGFSE